MHSFRLLLNVLGLSVALATTGQAQSTQQPGGGVIFVLDGSGSMWGQIDGTPKISIARDVMSDLIADWPEGSPMGLVAYGHRREGDCKDIELIQPVGNVEPGALTKQVQNINALGKTPLSASLAFAAVRAGWTYGKTDVVLVTDGLETCGANPCAMATWLEQEGVDFTTHVIGFDLTQEESAQLTCIADATGGSFLNADSASGLAEALKATTIAAVAPPAPATPAPKPAQVAPPEPEAAPQVLLAKLCAACDPLPPHHVAWALSDGDAIQYSGLGEVRHNRADDLLPGRYSGSAQMLSGALQQTVEIIIAEDGKQSGVVDLNGGYAKIDALNSDASDTTTDQIYFTYSPILDGVVGAQLAHSGQQNEDVVLPVGAYLVTARIGDITDSAEIVIEAGQTTPHTFDMRVGYALPKVVMAPGGKVFMSGIHYGIFRTVESAEANTGQLASGAGGYLEPLRPGRYGMRLEVYGAGLEGRITRIVPIDINPDETMDTVFDLNSGYLDHTISSAEKGFSVFVIEYVQVDAAGNSLGTNSKAINAKAKARLPEGLYELKIYNHGEYYYSDPFQVTAGDTTIVSVAIP